MGIIDKLRDVRDWVFEPLTNSPERARTERIDVVRDYRAGLHRPQLKTKLNQADYNISLNYTRKIINKTSRMLFGKGVTFDVQGDTESPEQVYIEKVWRLNRGKNLLLDLAMLGAEAGTVYVKFIDGYHEEGIPRLVALDPAIVKIHTDPEDKEIVTMYEISFTIPGPNGKDIHRRQEIYRGSSTSGILLDYWEIVDYEMSDSTGWKWVEIGRDRWDYEFPPIVHCKNLPNPVSAYGEPDITEDIINLQDNLNRVTSNTNKIISYHAHPKTVVIGTDAQGIEKMSTGPDEMFCISNAEAKVSNLEMQSELIPIKNFEDGLKQAMFDITDTTDNASVKDKVGQLTNFALRVLYKDSLDKMETKRSLYGEMLIEINRRLLILRGFTPKEPCKIEWPEPLPEDETQEIDALTKDLANGLVSKQKASEKRGYEWEVEQERMAEEQADEDNIGAAILRNFNQGR